MVRVYNGRDNVAARNNMAARDNMAAGKAVGQGTASLYPLSKHETERVNWK